ncbi:MAG: COX15/CtaA family protein [Gammaproteobacteria bacterium]|nr:COX15/CtaA family protein [Gammaproteobacteria bacterium]
MGQNTRGAASASSAPFTPERANARPIALWLLTCCGLIAIMVLLGGVTRLRHAGLSIVEWQPFTGVLPPLTAPAWEDAFAQYQRYPEYQKLNRGMTLGEFKSIFWLEYLHRLWGRLIGIAFLVPCLYFALRRRIGRALIPKLAMLFALGGLQGALGWYMVKSGLVDRPDVSQYRLSAHLGLAASIYGYMLWVALGLLRPRIAAEGVLPRYCFAVLGLVFATLVSGGFVAGLDAGFAYNTFPLMQGQWIPEGLWHLQPFYRNLFENLITVQFMHRILALASLLAVGLLWLAARRSALPASARRACHGLLGACALQVALGISTLVFVVPLPLALAHQAGALVLLTIAIWTLHEMHGPRLRSRSASLARSPGSSGS